VAAGDDGDAGGPTSIASLRLQMCEGRRREPRARPCAVFPGVSHGGDVRDRRGTGDAGEARAAQRGDGGAAGVAAAAPDAAVREAGGWDGGAELRDT